MIVEVLAELLVADPRRGAVIGVRRRVADERGDRAESGDGFVDQMLEILIGRDVRRDCNRGTGAVLCVQFGRDRVASRSEEHTSELQSLMRISYAVLCWKKKKTTRKA